jgi:hypothetical protein
VDYSKGRCQAHTGGATCGMAVGYLVRIDANRGVERWTRPSGAFVAYLSEVACAW